MDVIFAAQCSCGGDSGRIELTHENVHWQSSTSSRPRLVIRISDIGSKQTAKGKPMLRLTASGLVEPVMFQFGTLEQRDACVDAINQLGSVVRGQGGVGSAGPGAASLANDSDAELKVRLLASTPGLAELHRNLVRSGGLTEAEFWSGAERKMLLEKEHYKQKAQARGLSSTFHEQILTRSSNLRITPQMVTQILVERPAVQRALLTFVSGHLQGDDLKKKHHEFWKLYVKYCKVRLNNGPLDDDLQLFRQCEEDEDRSMRERDRVRAKEVDPTVDLIADRFDGFGIGYGLAPDNRRSDVNLSDAKNSRAIIRELNRHATAAVEGLPDSLRENAAAMADENWMDRTQAFADQLQRHEKQRSEQEAHPNYSRPLARRPDGLVLDDLLEDKEHERRLIPVNDVRKYFTGDENMPSTSMPSSSLSRNDCWSLAAAIDGVQRSNGSAAVIGCPAISESLATQALEEMARFEDDPATAQGALTFLRENRALVKSIELAAESIQETLRHFWGCFPLVSESRKGKAERMRAVIGKEYDKLESLRGTCCGQGRQYLSSVCKPLFQLMDAALEKK